MTEHTLPEITITDCDFARIDQLTAAHAPPNASRTRDYLVRELSRAEVVPSHQIAPDVVTMYS
jgi:hypothetical protein